MLVYEFYASLGTEEHTIAWGLSHPDIKLRGGNYVGFYKERGSYVNCLGTGPRGWMRYEYTGPYDVIELVSVARNITFPAGEMDVMCWRVKETGRLIWALANFLGFAVQSERNVFIIEP